MWGRREQPSRFELQILGVLWERGPMTARQVLQSLPDRKPRAYTSVLSVMQVMEKKGFLSRDVDEVAHIWRPKVSRRQVMGPMMSDLVRNAFGGRASSAMQQLLGTGMLDSEEISAMKKMLAEYDARKGKDD